MTVDDMRRHKVEKGYTYEMISRLSGVPLGTVHKIFTGETQHPRYDTLIALTALFQDSPCDMVREDADALYHYKRQGEYTVEDYRSLPEDQRVELIDGVFYDMAAPTYLHQRIAGEIYRQIANFIFDNGGACHPVIAPVDVQLDCDQKTMVQPDVAILCKTEKVEKWGIYGSPDFVLEILSPSTRKKDCIKKLTKYMDAGVREYWILDPYQRKLLVYFFEAEVYPAIYGLEGSIPVNIYEGKLTIVFENIIKWIDQGI